MDAQLLVNLNARDLTDYLWKRLRRERPLDPPLAIRFGPEAPAHFLLKVAAETDDRSFRARLIQAVADNFRRLARLSLATDDDTGEDETTDEQLAGLAFMISELKATELARLIYRQACSWLAPPSAAPLSFGQTHVLRALAQLQKPGMFEPFWHDLWEQGPRSLRGLVYFGWMRSDADSAYTHLGELADTGQDIDLSATVWSLFDPGVSNIIELAKAARGCTPAQRTRIRAALVAAGAERDILRNYDLNSSGAPAPSAGFPWSNPQSRSFRRPLHWHEAA